MVTAAAETLYRLLGHGESWTPDGLAEAAGLTPTGLNEGLENLRAMGLEMRRERGCVRLARAAPPLQADFIGDALPADVRRRAGCVQVAFSLPSTNDALAADQRLAACLLAEHQSAGRGRHGRQWHSPLGASLYLSMRRTFPAEVEPSGCLSIGVGQSVARRLNELGVPARVKWPNDIYVSGRKLAGILIESRLGQAGQWVVIIGIGLNYDWPPDGPPLSELNATDYRTSAPEELVQTRNTLAARIIEAVDEACVGFANRGVEGVLDEWPRWDAFPGAPVIYGDRDRQRGTAVGIDAAGRLLVATEDGTVALAAGDVSYQALADANSRRG